MIEAFKVKALDTLAAAHLNTQRSANPVNLLHGPKRHRVYTAINMADRVMPGVSQKVAEFVTNTQSFPFGEVENVAFAEGGENIIFLIDNDASKFVVKVNKKSIGASSKKLMQIAGQIDRDIDTIQSWYPGIPDITPPEKTIILNSHVSRLPAVATIQPYIPQPWHDIFTDFEADKLSKFLSGQQQLRGHFIHFAERTVDRYRATGQCVDLLGPKNISFIKRSGTRLNITDPHHIFDIPFIQTLPDNIQIELVSRIIYLENMASLI